ncbi:hypothetical protein [Pontibacterium sp.]|uniref:hypothetical protein n=1 Tax=Pontibacterium sp. TaxID=2036026 RepID=UPI003566A54F
MKDQKHLHDDVGALLLNSGYALLDGCECSTLVANRTEPNRTEPIVRVSIETANETKRSM